MKESKFVVEKNFSGLNCTELMEPVVNHLATEYFVENYETIIKQARKMSGVDPHKVEDLVNDVFKSLLEGENAGEGYDISHSREGSVIGVADFVYGRLKMYSKNRRYAVEGCDRRVSTKRIGDTTVTNVEFDIGYASTLIDLSESDHMDSLQRALMTAHSYDAEIESIEDEMSLRNDIEFCLDFNEVVGMDLMNLFRNMDAFSAAFDASIFDSLKAAMKEHDELGEALHNVLTTAVKQRSLFDAVLATF